MNILQTHGLYLSIDPRASWVSMVTMVTVDISLEISIPKYIYSLIIGYGFGGCFQITGLQVSCVMTSIIKITMNNVG